MNISMLIQSSILEFLKEGKKEKNLRTQSLLLRILI
jgi:hypothetical protein